MYWFQQHAKLNSNTYFNRLNALPVPAATNYTYGGRIGGPIILPGFDGRGKAFFFFNQEEVYNPIETARSRTIIRQSALDGNFTYGASRRAADRERAGARGRDGHHGRERHLRSDHQGAARIDSDGGGDSTGTISELVTSPNTAGYDYLVPNKGIRHTPTVNITVNLSPKHRLQGSYYWQRFNNTPDTLNSADADVPGLPGVWRSGVLPDDRVHVVAVHDVHARSSTKCAAAGSGRRSTSSPTPRRPCSTTRAATT